MQDKKENSRVLSYLSSHLSPIDFIQEYQDKKLPVSILFYKVCSSFPKVKLGGIKGAYRHIQEEKLDFLKEYFPQEVSQVLKDQRDYRPKIGQYAEFLITSMLLTTVKEKQELDFAPLNEDIQSGWDFIYKGQKYDITTNLSKISKPGVNLIKINLVNFLDEGNLLLEHGLIYLAQTLNNQGITLDGEKVNYANLLVNKIRSKYIEISNHQVRTRKDQNLEFISIKENDNKELKEMVPDFAGEKTAVESLSYSLKTATVETLELVQTIEKLSPEKKQIIKSLIKKLTIV